MNGLRATVEPAPANPHTSKRVDFTVRGLLGNGGVLYGDTVITTVTCKSHANDAAIVDGAAAAKAAAGKVGKHRDLVLAGNPDNRFVPFAVEEGGRLGTDAVYIYYPASAPARCGPLAAVGAITRPPSQPQTASERS